MRFTPSEIEYLNSQPLGRLATVGPGGRPHVVAVGVFYDPETETIVVGGHAGTNMAGSKKFREAQAHPEVAFLVDDLASVDPWTPRGIEIRGRAETHTTGGEEIGRRVGGGVMPFDAAFIHVYPRRIVAHGIDAEELNARAVA